jgi:hypothetical protein
MRFIFIILFGLCYDCIYYKEPNIIFNIYKKNNDGFCFYHKNYALLSRLNEKKCGINGKDFSPRFRKIKPIE